MAINNTLITGLGVFSPLGTSIEEVWQNLLLKKKLFQFNIDQRFELESSSNQGLSVRDLRKIDRFTIFAFNATKEALLDSGVILTTENKDTIGLLIGNNFGGWSYVEPQMYGLYQGDMDSINPYVATSWFPAAPQGEISIKLGISGYSKTFSAGHLSVAYALEHGMYMLQENYLKFGLIGGSEAPLTPLLNSTNTQHNTAEGAAMFCVSQSFGRDDNDKQLAEHDRAYARIVDININYNLVSAIDGLREKYDDLKIDVIVSNIIEEDAIKFLSDSFIRENHPIIWVKPEDYFGDTMGAEFAFNVVVASKMLFHQVVLATDESIFTQYKFQIIKENEHHMKINRILVLSKDATGQSVALLLEKIHTLKV